jgi:cytochrome P450
MTTVPSSSAAILDIASAPPEIGLYQQLRQEARKVLTSEEEWVEPSSFNKLHYTDSAIRETLRLTPVVLHGSNREIIHPSGLTMPSGQHLPRGMWVAGSTLDIHMDERFYAEAQQYKPFRFVKGQTSEDGTGMSEQKINRVATASTFLTFGTGRHAW